MTEQQRAWAAPPEKRRISPTPTTIPPHPDRGGLPPCDYGTKSGRPCPRPATTHHEYAYYCGEHAEAVLASHRFDEAGMAVHHAKRFLWKAQVEGIERLEHHIGEALAELEEERLAAEREMDVAYERADRVGGGRPGEGNGEG